VAHRRDQAAYRAATRDDLKPSRELAKSAISIRPLALHEGQPSSLASGTLVDARLVLTWSGRVIDGSATEFELGAVERGA